MSRADRLTHDAESPALVQITSLSLLVMVAFGTLLYAYSVFITAEGAGSEYSISLLSLAWTGAIVVGGVSAVFVGRYADRYGVRGLMGIGSVVGAAGLILLAASQAGWQVVLVSWLLIGSAGAMTFYEPAFIAVDQWFGLAGSTRSLAMLTVIGGLAGPIFLPLTGVLVVNVGWRSTAVAFALVLLVVGLTSTTLVFPKRLRARDAHSEAAAGPGINELLKDRRFAMFTASVLLTLLVLHAVIFHRIAVFEEAGFTVTVVAGWAAIAGLLSLPGRWVTPYLSNRIRPVFVAAGLSVLMAAATALAAMAAAPWQLAGHFVVFGIAFGATATMRAVVMGRWYSGPSYGRIMGWQWTIVATLAAVGPLLVGVLRDGTGSYTLPMALATGILLISAVLAVASEPLRRARSTPTAPTPTP